MERSTPLSLALRAVRPALGSAFLISVFVNLTLFASPLYSMQVYDRVLSSRNLGTLLMLTLIVVVFIALYGFLEYVRSGVLIRGSVKFNEALSKPLFEAALRARLNGREQLAAQSFKDADCVRENLASGTISSLFDTPWTIVFVGMCYLLHPALGAVALLGTLSILACAILTEFLTRNASKTASRAAAETGQFSASVLRNAESVRGLGMNATVLARWNARQLRTLGANALLSERGGALVAVSKSVRLLVQIGLLCTGAWLAVDRLVSPGVMIASMIIMGRALAPVEQAVANWKRVVAFREAHSRLTELFAQLPASTRAIELPRPQGHVSVEELIVVTPREGQPILKGVSFALAAGESLAIIGPSGSGKSTLARSLAGIWQPAKGAVRLDGAALSQWQPERLGPHIGYLPQDIEFLPGTIAENIARMAEPNDEMIIAAAQAAKVHEVVLRLPNGYDTRLGEGGVALSGGQRQRLALARALYGNPRLIVMDEPNSNLDSEGEAGLSEALARMKERKQTVVVVTHKMQILRDVDRVLALSDGIVRAFGRRDDMLAKLLPASVQTFPARIMPRTRPTRMRSADTVEEARA